MPKINKKIVLILLLLSSLVTYAAVSNNRVEVRVESVTKNQIEDFIEVQGKIKLKDHGYIYSEASGYIDNIEVSEGDYVEANQIIATISNSADGYEKDRLEETYKSALLQLKRSENEILPEQLNQLNEELSQIEIQCNTAKSEMDYSVTEHERMQHLFENGAVSKQALEKCYLEKVQKTDEYQSLDHQLMIKKCEINLFKSETMGNAMTQKRSDVNLMRLRLEEMNQTIEKSDIVASIKGHILSNELEEGQFVQKGDELIEIGDMSTIVVEAFVLTDDAVKLQFGQKVEISGEALNDNVIIGEISYIAPKAIEKTSSLGVKQQKNKIEIKIEQNTYTLKKGYEVDLKIITDSKENTLVINEDALFEIDNVPYVFVVDSGKAQRKEVEIGIENDTFVEVVNGLDEGEVVITELLNTIDHGTRIKSNYIE